MIKKISPVLLFILSLIVTIPVNAAVVVNEIEPKYADPAQAWVELYNTGGEPVSLNLWKIDHTGADASSFIINASYIIQPHGFVTFSSTQTNLHFSINGDTVRLFDQNGTLADSESYPGTLGYNTSMGRSTDGGEGWVICSPEPYSSTPNAPNNCPPAPTVTPTPTPAATATPSPIPTATPTPTPLPASGGATRQTFGSMVLGATIQPTLTPFLTPTPTPASDVLQLNLSKSWIAYIFLGIAAAALSLMLTLWLRQRSRGRS